MEKSRGKESGPEMILEELKRKSFRGMGSLLKRQAAVRALSFLANVALARLLVPQVFGIYAIVSFVVQVFSTFGDVGLGAALIQRKGDLSRKELSSTFWFQQGLVWTVVCAILAAAPLAVRFYPSLPAYGVWLIRSMAAAFAVTSLRTIPGILLERNIDFGRVAMVDIAETVAFYGTAIPLAMAGLEVWSFIIAAFVRACAGVAIMYRLSRWRPSLEFDFASMRGLLRFGLPFQANNALGLVKDSVTPIFVGAYCGAAAVGYVNLAKSVALAPLMLSEAFGRVAFPAFSRIRGDSELLGKAVERSMRCITLGMFPVTALMLAMGPEIIRVVFTEKWLPGITAYYFYCTSPFVIGIVLPMYSAILASGRSGTILKMTVGLLAVEWGFGVPFVMKFGFNGIAFTQPITAVLFYFVYKRVLAKEKVRVSLVSNLKWQFLAAASSGMLCREAVRHIDATPLTLPALFCAGLAFYGAAVFALDKTSVREFLAQLRKLAGRGEGSA